MEHTQDRYLLFMNELFRCCGRLNLTSKEKQSRKTAYVCRDYVADLLLVFDIDINSDDVTKHSKYFCHNCMSSIRNSKQRQSAKIILFH